MAFSNNGLPAQALRYSMLAVASVHRGDSLAVYTRYKGAALRALAASVTTIDGDTGEAARHVAGVMLLSSLYMQPCFMTGNEWLVYLNGAREVIKKSGFASMVCDSDDVSELMDWVYHQDVFSRFTSFHWRRGEGNPFRRLDEVPEYQIFNHPLRRPKQGRQILGLFHDVFDLMLYQAPAAEGLDRSRDEEMARVTQLTDEVESMVYADHMQAVADSSDLCVGEDPVPWRENDEMPSVFELYRLSALLCLARTGESRFGWPASIEAILDKAMAVMQDMETCQRQFPVLVLGSQARTEEQRRVVIDLLERSTKSVAGRTLVCLQKSIEFSWVQADLHADEDLLLDFGQLMRTLCGNCMSVPNLA
ncbi:fungal-specific transcription factor domain-domain-containing protein [Microdochium bolleyi]|uniref:Fungal-specific transcription factor domain-domain-containing protein n=1 Tax=Microdochium bolleyi TaxID=196109 RepID=A0A136IV38_9PEZI|nr:fungal-specific transcription factor domain-domain-containing protein [Microdochium bolleyi]